MTLGRPPRCHRRDAIGANRVHVCVCVCVCIKDGVAVAPPRSHRRGAADRTHGCVYVYTYISRTPAHYVSSIISSSEPTANGEPRMSSILSRSSLSFSSWGLKTSWFRMNSCSMSK